MNETELKKIYIYIYICFGIKRKNHTFLVEISSTKNFTKKNLISDWILDTYERLIHWCSKFNEQPVLLFSSFVHDSSINEHKNMKLRENVFF